MAIARSTSLRISSGESFFNSAWAFAERRSFLALLDSGIAQRSLFCIFRSFVSRPALGAVRAGARLRANYLSTRRERKGLSQLFQLTLTHKNYGETSSRSEIRTPRVSIFFFPSRCFSPTIFSATVKKRKKKQKEKTKNFKTVKNCAT